MGTPPEVDQDQQQLFMNFNMAEQKIRPYVSIPQFYAGRSVFITGGTGESFISIENASLYNNSISFSSSVNAFRVHGKSEYPLNSNRFEKYQMKQS